LQHIDILSLVNKNNKQLVLLDVLSVIKSKE
jgi:hypothetical protein